MFTDWNEEESNHSATWSGYLVAGALVGLSVAGYFLWRKSRGTSPGSSVDQLLDYCDRVTSGMESQVARNGRLRAS